MAQAAEKSSVVAVFAIEDTRSSGARLSEQDLKSLTEYETNLLAQGESFKVVPTSDLQRAMREGKKESYKACFDESCQIDIGKALAAQLSLATKILKVGRHCVVAATMYDLRHETTVKAASRKGSCSVDALGVSIEDIVEELRSSSNPKPRAASGKSSKASCGSKRDCNSAGVSHYRSGEHKKALAFFERAIQFDANYVYGHYNVACMHALLGDVENALAAMKRLEKIADPKAKKRLSKPADDPDWEKIRSDPRVQKWIRQHSGGLKRATITITANEDLMRDVVPTLIKTLERRGLRPKLKGKSKKTRQESAIYAKAAYLSEARGLTELIPGGASVETITWDTNSDVVIAVGASARGKN